MTVREIVTQWLIDHGYDGLWNEAGECACDLSDLIPCGGPCDECQAGYKTPCDCGEHHYHIGKEKP
jgi:hypothetical protein